MASVIRVACRSQALQAKRALGCTLYCSSRRQTAGVNKEHGTHPVDESLFFKKVPVEQNGVKYEVTVVDTGQIQPQHPVALLIHGAPGGSIDLVNLIPFLLKEKLRIIAPNFPGYGVTKVSEQDLFRIPQSTEAKADLVTQILKQLNINSVELLVSHSQGSMTAYKVCAEQDVKAAAFINATGYYPQRGARPLWLLKVVASLFHFAPIRPVIRPLLVQMHHKAGFTVTDTSAVETALRTCANAQFYKAKEYGQKIADKKLPVLFALSKSDKIVECARALDLLKNVLAVPDSCIVSYDKENREPSHHVETKPGDWYVRTLLFQTGGHLVHKAHEDIVIEEITRLLRFIQQGQ